MTRSGEIRALESSPPSFSAYSELTVKTHGSSPYSGSKRANSKGRIAPTSPLGGKWYVTSRTRMWISVRPNLLVGVSYEGAKIGLCIGHNFGVPHAIEDVEAVTFGAGTPKRDNVEIFEVWSVPSDHFI